MTELAAYFDINKSVAYKYISASCFAEEKNIDKSQVSPVIVYYLSRMEDRYEEFINIYPLQEISNIPRDKFIKLASEYIEKNDIKSKAYYEIEFNNKKYHIPKKSFR